MQLFTTWSCFAPSTAKRFWRLLPLSCLLLTACVTTQQTTTSGTGSASDPQWKTHLQEVNALRNYQTRGSFAYEFDGSKTYAKFFWQQYTPENIVYC